jgi:hypothetical protein
VTVVGGTGKYEGAKGDGTLTGVRVPGLATGVDRYDDLVIKVRKKTGNKSSGPVSAQ